jgi:hypothetical protein
MKLGSEDFVLISQVVNFPLILRYSHQQLGVCLFSSQESVDNLVDIRVTSGGSDLLESVLNNIVLIHLTLHLSFKESREESLYQKLLLHFNLILILILISSHLGNFSLSLDSLHSSSEGIFFVSDRFLQALNSLLSFPLVHFDLHHDLVKLHFCLNSLLFSSPLLVGLIIQDIGLGLVGVLELLGFKLG